ncbi:hypothetical protein ACFSTC_32630 [Nonomuraea ferruginea]
MPSVELKTCQSRMTKLVPLSLGLVTPGVEVQGVARDEGGRVGGVDRGGDRGRRGGGRGEGGEQGDREQRGQGS